MAKNKSMKKMNRVSKLINDIRSSSKRNDHHSLVVQTGFPTVLIDLFVKHRDRLHKSSLRKQNNNNDKSNQAPPPSTDIRSTAVISDLVEIESDDYSNSRDDSSIEVFSGEKKKSRLVFMNVVKMFVILSFAFSTKRLAISITFWAFLLLFLEFWFGSQRKRVHGNEVCFESAEENLIEEDSLSSSLNEKADTLTEETANLIEETDTATEVLQFDSKKNNEECRFSDQKNIKASEEEPGIESLPNKMCRAKSRAKQLRKLVANKFRTTGRMDEWKASPGITV